MSRHALTLIAALTLSGCLRELVIVEDDGDEGDDKSDGQSDDKSDEDPSAEACASGQVDCTGECVTLATDVDHCGACDVVCLPGQTCSAGECHSPACGCDEARELCVDGACECRPGLAACDSTCVDLRSNVDHCGGCDQPCAGVCVDGECEGSCESPNTLCGGACVDLDSNPLHCEECGETCDADEVCVEGKCRDYTFAACTSCPCECGSELGCCESSSLDAVLCVYDEACPP